MQTSYSTTLALSNPAPRPDCREIAWSRITDFINWMEILPRLRGVQVVNADPIGRGSLVKLQWGQSEEEWQVSHWHPGRRLDLIRKSSLQQTGIRFDLGAGENSEQVLVKLDLEIRCYGVLSLFKPLLVFLARRGLRVRFLPLMRALEEEA